MPLSGGMERINCSKKPSDKLAQAMIHWGKIMGALKMVPYVSGKGWAGNMGFSEKGSVWVTPAGGVINDIKMGDIVGISQEGNKMVFWGQAGKKPTSEWEIFWEIFKKRKDIKAILHGHDLFALETAEALVKQNPEKVALTKGVTDAGSAEFRDEILEILTGKNTYLIGKGHGFFALGKTFEEAGMLSLEFRSMASELMVGSEEYKRLLDKYHIG